MFFPKGAFALTTPYRSATTVTTVGNPPYTNLENCSITDGLTCDRASANLYGDLDFRDFGDFGLPDDAVITHVRLRVTGKSQTPSLALFPTVSRIRTSGGDPFFESCQHPDDHWRMYILNSSTVRVYEVTTPLTNGYLDECLTLSNIRANNFIFRIHYSNSFAWSASIDNFEVAFDYTPAEAPTPPEPFLELPWDYEAKEKSFEEVVFNPRSWFDHEYPLQNVPCCENKVLKYTGELKDEPYRSHNGYDYGSKNGVFLGTEVLAAASGWATFKPESQSGGAGNVIKIDHGNGYQTWYEHLSPDNLIISSTEGRVYVEKGQKIGEVGMTGNTTGPHIHFSVFKDSNENDSFDDDIPWGAVDPLGWEGNYADPWTLFESNGRNGSQSYNLFIARTPPKQEEIQTTGGQVSIGDILVDIVSDTFNQAMQFIADYGPYESSSDGKIKSVMPSIFLNAFDSLGQKVTEFLQPATILYDYSDADLLNINEDSLKIYWFNEDSGEWEALPSFVDSINKTVSTQTTHFSQFALMGEIKDLTPPVTDVIISGEKGQDNWYRSNVSIELNGYDNEDGVGIQYTLYTFNGSDWFEYKDPILISDEGTYTLTYESYDKAENTEDRKAAVFKIDKTPPELSANVTVEGEPYATNTWTNRDVLITFSCVDGLSGVFWFSDPVLIVSEGENQKVTGECKDNAGNTVEEEVEGINIDKTNPSISIWITPQILWPPNGKLVPVTVDGEIQELNLSSKTFNIIDEYGFEMPQINDFGKAIYLQAQRNDWDFDGREYIINVEAIDLAGNKSSTQTKVVVPHDQGKE